MQFAGIRTDDDFNVVGEPDNWLVKLTPDVLPDPYAVMITGITPQKTLEEGYTEAEFLRMVSKSAFQSGTVMLGFNTIRFDDEFIRYSLYRNFYDPYEREWANDCARWDIIDAIRMTRALRPEGIVWPTLEDGTPSNKLELLSEANGLDHVQAHDALSDVRATIAITKLLKEKQPKIFAHLYSLRAKKQVTAFFDKFSHQPFVHSSGHISSAFLSTTSMAMICKHPMNPNALLSYDLRVSPKQFANASREDLKRLLFGSAAKRGKDEVRLPIKAVHLNKSPAVAPLSVLDDASQERIKLTLGQIETHFQELQALGSAFADRVQSIFAEETFTEVPDADTQLYAGFMQPEDKKLMQRVRGMSVDELAQFQGGFRDERFNELTLRYKARNYPASLSEDEQSLWEQYRANRLTDTKYAPLNMTKYFKVLEEIAGKPEYESQAFLIEELRLYGESIVPFENQELL